MDVPVFDIADLGAQWWSPSEAEVDDFVAELRFEMPADHVLANVVTKPVAAKKHLKDWIVWLPQQGRWAAVHLTYTPEADPRWPAVTFASSWPEVLAELV